LWRQAKITIIGALARGAARKSAAEIKPVEPVWVIPAKGAALTEAIHTVAATKSRPRVAIIGAGVVGLGIAWRLAGRATVTVFDRGKAGAGASHAAAGMLAACCEAEPGEEALVALGRESQARWPAFAEELKRASGIDVELRREGTLVLALTADDQAEIAHRLEFQRQLDLPLEWLSAAATRAREPHLAGKIAGALFSPQDHQVDNRKLVQALRIAAESAGVKICEQRPVKEIVVQGGRAKGVAFEDGAIAAADIVVLAAGAWSRSIGGLPPDRRPPVRPVKGQMLSLRMDAAAPLLTHVLWAPGAYLVPRRDGRLIVGGTVEEKGFDDTITAGGMLTLLEAAWRAIPAIEELPIDEIWVGHRPGSRDDAPILGPGPLEGLFYATGHHRNGILLAPVTADAMARLVLDEVVEPSIKPFGLERFLPARAAE
jgi:glycine oxidase